VNNGTISGYVKLRPHRTDFLVVFVAFAFDDENVAVAMAVAHPVVAVAHPVLVVAHPVSVFGLSWFSDEWF
jgi:hypothetical protein